VNVALVRVMRSSRSAARCSRVAPGGGAGASRFLDGGRVRVRSAMVLESLAEALGELRAGDRPVYAREGGEARAVGDQQPRVAGGSSETEAAGGEARLEIGPAGGIGEIGGGPAAHAIVQGRLAGSDGRPVGAGGGFLDG